MNTEENKIQTNISPSEAGEYSTPYISLRIEDGILFGTWADNTHVNLEVAKECVKARLKFQNSISYPALIDMRGVKSASKEAREYMANEGAQLITAGALLIDSLLTRTIGNIFLTINKPPVPSKLFTEEQKAIEWLKQFV